MHYIIVLFPISVFKNSHLHNTGLVQRIPPHPQEKKGQRAWKFQPWVVCWRQIWAAQKLHSKEHDTKNSPTHIIRRGYPRAVVGPPAPHLFSSHFHCGHFHCSLMGGKAFAHGMLALRQGLWCTDN